jgi:hypothetical protein
LWIGENAAIELGFEALSETQKHILRECRHPEMVKVRNQWRGIIVDQLKVKHMQRDEAADVLETLFELAHGHPDGHSVFTGLLFPDVLAQVHDRHGDELMNDK